MAKEIYNIGIYRGIGLMQHYFIDQIPTCLDFIEDRGKAIKKSKKIKAKFLLVSTHR